MKSLLAVFLAVSLQAGVVMGGDSDEGETERKKWRDSRDYSATAGEPSHKVIVDNSRKHVPKLVIDKRSSAFKLESERIKNRINENILAEGKQGWRAHNKPQDLFGSDYELETDIFKLKTKGETKESPWSGYYYPISYGGVSARWGDGSFTEFLGDMEEKSYEGMVKFYTQPEDFFNTFSDILTTGKQLMHYSAAEKYDLLVGDMDFSLTKAHKELGYKYVDEDGKVADWMGICHGWAVASYRDKRTLKDVEVMSLDGKHKITFHWDDLRALLSLKWAQSSLTTQTLYVGGRCNKSEDELKLDEKTGRVLDEECNDTNAGTWHLIVANKVGIQRESFVFDATFDLEVWNHPIRHFKVDYHHPLTWKTGSLAESIVPIDREFKKKDPLYRFRKNRRAKKVVGVSMEVGYISESLPLPSSPHGDVLYTTYYYYDLELDRNNNIVGGEWRSEEDGFDSILRHPDFIWTVKENSKANNSIDTYLQPVYAKALKGFASAKSAVVVDKVLQGNLKELSQLSVQNDSSPLSVIIDALVSLSINQ